MKPFDLEAAKRGEPIITRDGRPVKFIAHVPEAENGSRVLVLEGDSVRHHFSDGHYYGNSLHPFDLFMAPRKRTVWVRIYGRGHAVWTEYDSSTDSDKAHPIEIEE